ncbi:MAG: hypothetical protein QM790_18425 [Nibricoccus sp.]
MKTKLLNSVLFSIIVSSVAAAGTVPLAECEANVERAALRMDGALLSAQTSQIDQGVAAAPNDPALRYFRAFAYYAEGCVARTQKDAKKVIERFETAVKELEAIKDPSWEDEAAGFQGYILNQLIGPKGGASAMSLGPKSSALIGKALRRAPGSPRVMFFQGVVLVMTPEMFGGDLDGGIKLLERADAAFEKQPEEALIHWGHAEALAWLGIAKQKHGDVVGARKAWEHALAIEPEYGWVKYVLLPSLNRTSEKSKK